MDVVTRVPMKIKTPPNLGTLSRVDLPVLRRFIEQVFLYGEPNQ